MEYLYERLAYLKGLAEGMNVSEATNEGKLLVKILDVLEDFADSIVELEETQVELDEYVEAIDEDLGELEDEIYDYDEEDEDDDDDFDYVEITCPNCDEDVYLDATLFDGDEEILCPNCHEVIPFDMDCCDEEDCACNCGCDK